MPKLRASKEEVQGLSPLPEGTYQVRLDGFKPAFSSKRDSVNLNPQMKVINHPEYNDRQIFDNLNTKAKWIWIDFCHAFGLRPIEVNEGIEFPGNFDGPEDDPTKWQYSGPLLGQIASLYLIQADNTKGGITNKIKFYSCRVDGVCDKKHSTNLAKS